jgi:hypothetical protein
LSGPRIAGRIFTLIVSAVFIAIGIMMIADGNSTGWLMAGFFTFCLLVAVFEPKLPKPWLKSEFNVVITPDEVTCEFRKRKRESIRWEDVIRVWYVTTADGPHLPDEWIVLEGAAGGCSFPTEVKGIGGIWDELQTRFPGFDFGPIIEGGTEFRKHLCWEKAEASEA